MLASIMMHLSKVNVLSLDDGAEFVVDDRIRAIESLLAGSHYRRIRRGGLSYIYCNEEFASTDRAILISCHADSLYRHYSCEERGDELLGTFDNSISAAVVVDHMLRGVLPPGVLVAFTGDEENELRGVGETMRFLTDSFGLSNRLEFAIALDITAEGYAENDFTIENLFVREPGFADPRLDFEDQEQMAEYIKGILGDQILIIPDAAADEAWEYDEWDLNCLSLCIPTRPPQGKENESPGKWMHSDDGVLVRKRSIERFSKAIETLCKGIADTLH